MKVRINNMRKITFGELLQYFSKGNLVQVIMDDRDWEDYEEMFTDSKLLIPFFDWTVTAMGCEEACLDGTPTIRVSIKKGEIENEETVDSKYPDICMFAVPCRRVS